MPLQGGGLLLSCRGCCGELVIILVYVSFLRLISADPYSILERICKEIRGDFDFPPRPPCTLLTPLKRVLPGFALPDGGETGEAGNGEAAVGDGFPVPLLDY